MCRAFALGASFGSEQPLDLHGLGAAGSHLRFTIRLAMRYGCQLVDNDNYRDWKREENRRWFGPPGQPADLSTPLAAPF